VITVIATYVIFLSYGGYALRKVKETFNAESVDSLNSKANYIFLIPAIAVLSALILTGVASFSYDFRLLTLIFFISVG